MYIAVWMFCACESATIYCCAENLVLPVITCIGEGFRVFRYHVGFWLSQNANFTAALVVNGGMVK